MSAKLRVVVCLVELSVFLLNFFWGIFPSLLLNIMKRSSPASFEKKNHGEKKVNHNLHCTASSDSLIS